MFYFLILHFINLSRINLIVEFVDSNYTLLSLLLFFLIYCKRYLMKRVMKLWPQQNKTSLDICIAICYKGYHIIYESIVKASLLSPSADICKTIYVVK